MGWGEMVKEEFRAMFSSSHPAEEDGGGEAKRKRRGLLMKELTVGGIGRSMVTYMYMLGRLSHYLTTEAAQKK